MQSLLLNPPHHITRKLESRIIMLPRCFPETDIARAHGDYGIPIRLRERDVRVVLCGVDVQMVGFLVAVFLEEGRVPDGG